MANGRGPNPNELTVLQAKQLIREYLRRRIRKYAVLFGVANLLAAVGIYFALMQAATSVARSKVETYLDTYLADRLKQRVQMTDDAIKEIAQDAKKDVQEAEQNAKKFVSDDYPILLAKKLTIEQEVQDLQKSVDAVRDITQRGASSFCKVLSLSCRSLWMSITNPIT